MKSQNPILIFKKRLKWLVGLILISFTIIVSRLFYLQLFNFPFYQRLANQQHFFKEWVYPKRGKIEDCHGVVLAMNVNLLNVYARPQEVKNKRSTARVLSQILKIPEMTIFHQLESTQKFVWIERQVPFKKSKFIKNLKIQGIGALEEEKRFYPDHKMAANVIGFTGIDNQGLNGLEEYYNRQLSGKPGWILAARDARGKIWLTHTSGPSAPVSGLTLVTTLNSVIQHIAQVELKKAYKKFHSKKACIIVMNPKTGAILAMANYPTFDPNHFLNYPEKNWDNACITDAFEPGSTFKLITMTAALQTGIEKPSNKIFCDNGTYTTSYGRVVQDAEKYGWLTVKEIFGYSSNIGTTKIAMKLGKKLLYRYAKKFNIGSLTGIDLPAEACGLIRPPQQWGDFAIASIPYGYEVLVTPLQTICAYAAIANKGIMMRPYIVKEFKNTYGEVVKKNHPHVVRRVCSPSTANTLINMMQWVVLHGTGTAVQLSNYSVAGKTGTAELLIRGRYSHNEYYASFVGFVPAHHPMFAIYVSFEDPRGIIWGGYTAGPVFKRVARRILAYDMIPGKEKNGEQVAKASLIKIKVPNFVGLTVPQCKFVSKVSGCLIRFQGHGNRVIAQSQVPDYLYISPLTREKVLLTLAIHPDLKIPKRRNHKNIIVNLTTTPSGKLAWNENHKKSERHL
jgi:cell division protein FtsI/penicillin-binding protein 2